MSNPTFKLKQSVMMVAATLGPCLVLPAMAYGVNLGIHGRLTPAWQMGVRFLSQVTFNYDGADASFRQVYTGLTLAANNPLGAPAGTPLDSVLAGQFRGTGALVDQKVAEPEAYAATSWGTPSVDVGAGVVAKVIE